MQDRVLVVGPGELVIDLDHRTVTLAGRAVELAAEEFDLLALLAAHPGRVFDRAQLFGAVWGAIRVGYAHKVESHLNRLRSKLEPDAGRARYVVTARGTDYRFGGVDRSAGC